MRTLGFGEGRQAEQAMPEALGRRPGAKRSQSLPLRPLFRGHEDTRTRGHEDQRGMRTLGFGEAIG